MSQKNSLTQEETSFTKKKLDKIEVPSKEKNFSHGYLYCAFSPRNKKNGDSWEVDKSKAGNLFLAYGKTNMKLNPMEILSLKSFLIDNEEGIYYWSLLHQMEKATELKPDSSIEQLAKFLDWTIEQTKTIYEIFKGDKK